MNNDLCMTEIFEKLIRMCEEADTAKIPGKNTLKMLKALELHKLTLFQFNQQFMPLFYFLILTSDRKGREMRLTLFQHM